MGRQRIIAYSGVLCKNCRRKGILSVSLILPAAYGHDARASASHKRRRESGVILRDAGRPTPRSVQDRIAPRSIATRKRRRTGEGLRSAAPTTPHRGGKKGTLTPALSPREREGGSRLADRFSPREREGGARPAAAKLLSGEGRSDRGPVEKFSRGGGAGEGRLLQEAPLPRDRIFSHAEQLGELEAVGGAAAPDPHRSSPVHFHPPDREPHRGPRFDRPRDLLP